MSAATVFRAPLHATARWMRWYLLAVYTVAVAAAVVGSLLARTEQWVVLVGGALALGNLFLGMFLLAPALLLAVDARQLRLPGLQRDALLGMLLYGALAVVVPTLALAVLGGHAATLGLTLALTTLLGACFALLPRGLAMTVCALPLALDVFGARPGLPPPGQPGATPLWLGVLGVLGLACAACWRRELRSAEPYGQGWSRALVQQFRSGRHGWNAWTGFGGGQARPDLPWPAWLQPRAVLDGAGPQRPRRGLRVALGGLFMPQTPASWVRQLGMIAAPGILLGLLLGLHSWQRHGGASAQAFFQPLGLTAMLWLGGLGAGMLALAVVVHFHQRWQRPNAELSLLPLLPGLAAADVQRRELARAALLPPLYVQLGLLAVLLGIGDALGLHAGGLLLLALSQLGAIGFMLACTLCIFGRRALPDWAMGALAAPGFILVAGSLAIAALDLFGPLSSQPALAAVLAGGWLLYAAALLGVGLRGWRGLSRLPHPFLAP